jgi:hypothetical protein
MNEKKGQNYFRPTKNSSDPFLPKNCSDPFFANYSGVQATSIRVWRRAASSTA